MKPMRWLLLFIIAGLIAAGTTAAEPDGWQLISARKLIDEVNAAIFELQTDISAYQTLKISVDRFGVKLFRVVFLADDGSSHSVRINAYLAAGSESAPIRLPDGSDAIRRMKLTYYAKSWPRVKIWVKHD